MKKRTRRILFAIAVVVFAAAAWVVVKYAQGYALDWDTRTLIRTGALAVTANVDADVFVDDERVGSLSLLARRLGRDRLLPGSYTIALRRTGYSTWQKEALVEAGLLTDFPVALILPLDDPERMAELRAEASRSLGESWTLPAPKASVAADGWVLDAGRLFAGVASGSPLAVGVLGFDAADGRVLWWNRYEAWIRWTRDTGSQPYRLANETRLVGRWTLPVRSAAFWPDGEHVLVSLGSEGYRVIELDDRGGANTIRF